MSKSPSRTTRFPKTLAIIAAIVLLVLAIFFALEKFNVTNLTNVSSGSTSEDASGGNAGPTEEEAAIQTEAEANQKQEYLDSVKNADGSSSDSSDSGSMDVASMTVSASQSGDSITILTQIQNIAEGSCALHVSNGSKTTSQTAQIIYQPQFSSCAGFSVAKATLGTGSWNISVTITPANGSTITKATSLEVQ